MLKSFRFRSQTRRKAGKIYGAVVTQSRQPDFYAALGVADTPVGRYEMLVLHLILVLERLRAQGVADSRLDRLLVERFVADMDDSLRELATGDLAVPKKVRRAATGLYDRMMDYREGLAAEDAGALAAALGRYVYDAEGAADLPDAAGVAVQVPVQAAMLARYAKAAWRQLADVDVAAGEVVAFPAVPPFVDAAGADETWPAETAASADASPTRQA